MKRPERKRENASASALRREADLRQLELSVTRKLEGLLHGDYETLFYGPGTERGEGRPYVPSDDARRIDWSLTARMNEVHVRETLAERELETWLVVDISASLDFGTAAMEKRELAVIAAAAFGLLGARSGDRTGAIFFGPEFLGILPPRSGRKAVMELLRRLDSRPPAPDGPASLAETLRVTAATAKRRGRVVVISDLLDNGDWPMALRHLATRHDVIVAQISDPREWSLPASGLLTLVDPETGRTIEVQTSSRKLRQQFDKAASERRQAIDAAVQRAGARHVHLSTDRDWMRDLVEFAASTKKRVAR